MLRHLAPSMILLLTFPWEKEQKQKQTNKKMQSKTYELHEKLEIKYAGIL